ncbi:16S rRNA (cytosine(1402)-N(4))-methyltransferase RsmH [Acholeplasma hippikon]|nr:16S rRNA (cytosine(1402)-N(4))-methyltransferase RsmH [Acholeplasma hippikon]
MEHITVLLNESVEALNIKDGGIYVDATLGGGGHSELILKQLKKGHLYAFDQDPYAHQRAGERLKDYPNKTFIHANFQKMKEELNKLGIFKVDGILFDLGLSSFQIDDETRGFSYLKDYKLDMRMDTTKDFSAHTVVNTYSQQELADVFRKYGDEVNAWKIAGEIVKQRPLETTFDIVRITDRINRNVKGHSAKRVFQALRIEVNKELDVLSDVLEDTLELLNPGGRLVVITFHSLEDRITKQFMKKNSTLDVPKNVDIRNLPKPPLVMINRKAILPSEEELEYNKRSHSAQLRIAERQ